MYPCLILITSIVFIVLDGSNVSSDAAIMRAQVLLINQFLGHLEKIKFQEAMTRRGQHQQGEEKPNMAV
jgi:hypothetical protein